MTNADETIGLFPGSNPQNPSQMFAGLSTAELAPAAKEGHFDELRGLSFSKTASQSQSRSQSQSQSGLNKQTSSINPPDPRALTDPWNAFFNFLGADGLDDLNRRSANLKRQIRDNGVTYNVYADANGPQRPWSLDLFPLLISPGDWALIEAGIKQRTRLLNAIMGDVYGPQTLLSRGLLPAALVQGHPGYLRAMHGVQPAGGMFLHIAAFDLARGPNGQWAVVSQRTQAPSGLGYLLENRSSISMLFPDAFRGMQVHRLADAYTALLGSMKALGSPTDSRIVLLTSGPYNETYFEHAYLARYLGLTLVEGNDLLVRGEHLYLKTLQGLVPVHGVLKRLDDEFLDPLELRADSTLGVPGLLQVIRAGNVQIANAPGSAFLESSAILGFLPALSRELLGEALSLPSVDTWWCGEQAVMQRTLAQLKNGVIKPTYPATGMASVLGHTLDQKGLDEWAGRIVRGPEDYTVQAYWPLSQTPTWQANKITPRSAMLRVFALPDGLGSWRVLPGGLARLAGKDNNIASMQFGGSSADVWVLTAAPLSAPLDPATESQLPRAGAFRPETGSALHSLAPPAALAPLGSLAPLEPASAGRGQKQPVTSRAAENLFWLGRYSERAENSLRLAQIILQSMASDDQPSPPMLAWISGLAVSNCLVLPNVPPADQSQRVFERSLIAGLSDTTTCASVGFNLNALKDAASAVRERLSQEQWHVIVQMQQDFFEHCAAIMEPGPGYSVAAALSALDATSSDLAAITGAQTDRMMRDDGWRLLSIGRHIERLNMLSGALAKSFETGAVFDHSGFGAVVALFDSTITFHAQYQQRRDLSALLDLLVLDQDNPRSLAWVIKSLKNRLAKLVANTSRVNVLCHPSAQTTSSAQNILPTGSPQNDLLPGTGLEGLMAHELPQLVQILQTAVHHSRPQELAAAFSQCQSFASALSDQLSQRYFSHASTSGSRLSASTQAQIFI